MKREELRGMVEKFEESEEFDNFLMSINSKMIEVNIPITILVEMKSNRRGNVYFEILEDQDIDADANSIEDAAREHIDLMSSREVQREIRWEMDAITKALGARGIKIGDAEAKKVLAEIVRNIEENGGEYIYGRDLVRG